MQKKEPVCGSGQPRDLPAHIIFLFKQYGTEFKTDTFHPAKKEFVPTPAGQIYLEACREIIQVKNRTYQSMLSLSSQYTDRFTVGVTPHRGSTVFSKAFAQFYRRYPNIYIDIKEGYLVSLLQALDNHETDLVLGSVTKEDMITYNVMQNSIDELYLCVPDFHPLASLASPPTAPKAQINVERFRIRLLSCGAGHH